MRKKIFILLLMAIGTLSLSAYVIEDDPFISLLKKLEEFTKKYPKEKVHLHLDKPYYAVGDNIWFKAYTIDNRTSTLTKLSGVLYVELIDEKDILKNQLRLPMVNGISWGDFKLADTLSEGNYRIRAYTNWMRNAGPDFFFEKIIKIGNSWANNVFVKTDYQFAQEGNNEKVNSTIQFNDKTGKPFLNSEVDYVVELNARTITSGKAITNNKGQINVSILNTQPNIYKSGKITATLTLPDKQKITKNIPIKTTSTSVDVQFFPESGNLIQALTNRVAFKAINSEGKGEDIKGVIIDNEGVEITTFESSHFGMGSLYFNPQANKNYRAKVKFKNGSEKLFDLSKPESSGYVLTINNSDTTKVNIKVLITDDLIGKGDLHLLAQQNGVVYFSIKIPAIKNFLITSLPKAELPSGINTITLFNSANIAVAERLVFIDNKLDKIELTATNLSATYTKKAPMNLEFLGKNKNKPTLGSFSVSVTNASKVEPDPENETNIFTSLLLKSELKGYIEKPNYYFLSNDVKTRNDLDHLLLTQGWRKIDWKAVNNSQFPVNVFEPETALKISGTVTTYSGKPVVNGKVSLLASATGFALDTLTDINGRFSFNNLEFPDSSSFVIQARNEKDKSDVEIKPDFIPSQIISKNKNTGDIEINVNEQLKNYLQYSEDYFNELATRGMLNRPIQLKKVDITTTKSKKVENSANLNSDGSYDALFTAKDLENAISLSLYLPSRISNVIIKNNRAYLRKNEKPMAIIIDGMPMPDSLLDIVEVNDIQSIEVLKNIGSTAIYGQMGLNGILLITTKRGTLTYSKDAPGIITYRPRGYTISRKFYSPRYDANPETKPDLRTTVYWNPSIVSDDVGKFRLDYFNPDESGDYRIVIEGIDVKGNITRKTLTYQVK